MSIRPDCHNSGSQQALYILSQMDFAMGPQNFLEQPTYKSHEPACQPSKSSLRDDKTGFDGLDFDRLKSTLNLDRLSSSILSVVTPILLGLSL